MLEEKWAERQAQRDDVLDVDDPRDHSTRGMVLEKKVEELKPFTDPRTQRTKAIANLNTDMEITKKGYVRSDKEIEGIVKSKVKARIARKKAKMRDFNLSKKERTQQRRNARTGRFDLYFRHSFAGLEEEKNVAVKSETKQVKKEKYSSSVKGNSKPSKKERLEFRKMNDRKKAAKKNRKKARQAERKEKQIVTESFDLPSVDISSCAPVVEQVTQFVGDNKYAFQCTLFVAQMLMSTSISQDALIVSSFILNTGDERNLNALLSQGIIAASLRTLARRKFRPQTESLSEGLMKIGTTFELVCNSEIVNSIRNIVMVLMTGRVLNLEFTPEMRDWIGSVPYDIKKATIPKLVGIILNSFAALVRVGEYLHAGLPLSDILKKAHPLKEAMFLAKDLEKQYGRLYYGLPVQGGFCAKMFVTKAKEVCSILKFHKKLVNPLTCEGSEVHSSIAILEEYVGKVEKLLLSGMRPTPYGVVIAGDPGIGKSSLVRFALSQFSMVMNREFHHSHVFPRNLATEYWDGYDPISTPYVHYSEVGSTTKAIASRTGDPSAKELTSVVDSLPFRCNMSDVKDKGITPCRPEMVVVDTNNENMNFEQFVNNPSAYLRRFVFIRPRVKDEFRKEGTGQLDPAKTGDRYYDKWLFDVVRKEPQGPRTWTTVMLLKSGNIDDLSNFFQRDMYRHIQQQVKNIELGGESMSNYGGARREFAPVEELDGFEEKNFEPNTESWSLKSTDLYKTFVVDFGKQVYDCCNQAFNLVSLITLFYFLSSKRITAIRYWILILVFLSLFWVELQYVNMFLLIALIHIDEIAGVVVTRELKRSRNQGWINLKISMQRLHNYVVGKTIYGIPAWKYASLAGVFVSAAVVLNWLLDKARVFTEASQYEDSEVLRALNEREELTGCSKSYARIPVKNTKVWNTRITEPSVYTDTLDSFREMIYRNMRVCQVINGTRISRTHCFGICGNIAVFNYHALYGEGDSIHIRVYHQGAGGQYCDSLIRLTDLVVVQGDIVAVELSGIRFRDVVKHFPSESKDGKHVAMIGTDMTQALYVERVEVQDKHLGKIDFNRVFRYVWKAHTSGMCGIPLVARTDIGCCILGIHSAGVKENSDAFALHLTRPEVEKALEAVLSKGTTVMSEARIEYGSDPHPKSPIRYERLNGCYYYGAIKSVTLRQKSRLRKTVFAPMLDRFLWEHLGHVRGTVYVPPLMQPRGTGEDFVSPYNVGLRKMCVPKKALDRDMMRAIEDLLFEKFKDLMPTNLCPLDLETAVNGAHLDPFIRRINVSTAAGFGTPGKKTKYTTRRTERMKVIDEPHDCIKEEVIAILDSYLRGESYHPTFTAQLKDEPRDRKKVESGKTRLFYSTPYAFLIVQRMFLAPFYSLMVEKSESFFTAVGIDMHREADKLFARLVEFSVNIIEGDYSGYDVSTPTDISKCVNSLVLRLLRHAGYNLEALTVTAGILGDLLFPHVLLLGELLCFPGLQPSGKYATAEDNSLKNLVIVLAVWNKLGGDISKFFDHVLLVTYGDDLLAAVKDAPFFNALSFAVTIEEELGIGFTAADKGEVLSKYIRPEEMSFLKRTFRKHPVLDKIVAPLDLDSIYKMLEWRLPSAIVSEETQMEQTVCSAMRELFFHVDKHTYEKLRDTLTNILYDSYDNYTFEIVDYETILGDLCPQLMVVSGGRQQSVGDIVTESWDETCGLAGVINACVADPNTKRAFGRARFRLNQWPAFSQIRSIIMDLELELKTLEVEVESLSSPVRGATYRQVKRMTQYTTDKKFRELVDKYYKTLQRREATAATIKRLWAGLHRIESNLTIVTESEVVSEMTNADVSTKVVNENVTDVVGNETHEKSGGHSSELQVGQMNMLGLEDFLARPLALNSLSLPTDTDLTHTIDIWDAFLDHPSIRAKLRNYAYLRGTLHVRVAVSGTPFHYGRILASYQPLAAANANLAYVDTALTSATRWAGLTYLSQSHGTAVIDVRDNRPVDLECPFVSPQPMIRLFNNSPLILSGGAAFDDAVGLGKLYLCTINQVKSASPTPTPVSIFIYAWMTDVALGAPTGTVITIDTESEDMDERKTGPIERIATRASAFAHQLTSVPIIAPYARASGMALDGIGSLAALFGFSVPTMISEPTRVRPEPYQNGAQTIGYDTGKRITLDPKQELSVDPRVVGVEEDDMSLAAICARESLLDTFAWTDGTTPLASSIWMAPINPGIVKRIATGAPGPYIVAPTALAFAAAPFEYWRGTITFRFEIVCSAYHRGKIAFYFEPNISQNTVIDTELDMNKQYIKVVDIQKTQDVTLCVNWAFPKAWARTLTQDLIGDIGTVNFLGPALFDYANGYIAVTPFTSLQSPDGSDVSVNVYIKSDDMMFNQLTQMHLPIQRPTTESEELTPTLAPCMDLNMSSATTDRISEEHFGEVPVSFRGLLKRFVGDDGRNDFQLEPLGRAFVSVRNLYPRVFPAYDGVAVSRTSALTLFGYLRYAYLGMRGGMRFRHYLAGQVDVSVTARTVVHLSAPSDSLTEGIAANNSYEEVTGQSLGSVGFQPHTNSGVEFGVPFYSNNLFALSFSDDYLPASLSLVDNVATRGYTVWYFAQSRDTGNVIERRDFATGEDFSFFRFQGSPIYIYG